MAGTRFDCKEHSLFDGSGTAAGGAGGGPGVRGRRAVSVAPPRHSRRVACGLESAVQPGRALYGSVVTHKPRDAAAAGDYEWLYRLSRICPQ